MSGSYFNPNNPTNPNQNFFYLNSQNNTQRPNNNNNNNNNNNVNNSNNNTNNFYSRQINNNTFINNNENLQNLITRSMFTPVENHLNRSGNPLVQSGNPLVIINNNNFNILEQQDSQLKFSSFNQENIKTLGKRKQKIFSNLQNKFDLASKVANEKVNTTTNNNYKNQNNNNYLSGKSNIVDLTNEFNYNRKTNLNQNQFNLDLNNHIYQPIENQIKFNPLTDYQGMPIKNTVKIPNFIREFNNNNLDDIRFESNENKFAESYGAFNNNSEKLYQIFNLNEGINNNNNSSVSNSQNNENEFDYVFKEYDPSAPKKFRKHNASDLQFVMENPTSFKPAKQRKKFNGNDIKSNEPKNTNAAIPQISENTNAAIPQISEENPKMKLSFILN